MKLSKYHKLCSDFCQQAIDSELLMDIDKLTRYQGEHISNEHTNVENLGTVRNCTQYPKLNFGKNFMKDSGDFSVSKTETEPHYSYYDLTMVHSSSVCSIYDTFILVSERPDKFYIKKGEQSKTRLLKVFCGRFGYAKKEARKLPSINTIKKNLRKGGYTQYQSLLYEFCGVYSLARPNDNCDKMATLYTLIGCIEELKIGNPELFNVEVTERIENTHKAHQAKADADLARLKANNAALLEKIRNKE